jgi:hypothetical protein
MATAGAALPEAAKSKPRIELAARLAAYSRPAGSTATPVGSLNSVAAPLRVECGVALPDAPGAKE